jgi:(4S)-4-hydroxy-5-phosphonooxypentane-2,3-dione isomerase
MIWRLVHLKLQSARAEEFLALFRVASERITAQPGCLSLVLYQDQADPTSFATWSGWREDADLQEYKRSQLFAEFWPQVKGMLREPALAISYAELEVDEIPSLL